MTSPNSFHRIPSRDARVGISQIDLADLTYVFTFQPQIENLMVSIERIGLSYPPLIQKKGDGFRLVSGYKRVLALKRLGVKGFQAKMVKGNVPGLRLFFFNLYENLGTRCLSEVEKAIVVVKLIAQFGLSRSRVRDEILPLLELGKSDRVLDLYLDLAGMEEEIKEEMAGGRLSLEAVRLLAQIPKSEREKLLAWIKRLRLGKNRQKEFLNLLGDLAKLKGLSPSGILESPRVREVMARKDWPLPVKAQKVEEYLRGERYPVYRRAEEKYKKVVKDLRLPPNLSLNPPPYFEGEEYEVRFKFRDKTSLESAVNYLSQLSKGKTLVRLLSIP